MNEIGRKIFYEVATGNPIQDTGERQGAVIPTTVEQDIATYTALSERNRQSFDVLELPFGAYAQDFATPGVQYRVNLETKELEFSYPDPNAPEEPQPYQKPLSQEVKDLRMEVARSNTEMFEMMILMSGGGM